MGEMSRGFMMDVYHVPCASSLKGQAGYGKTSSQLHFCYPLLNDSRRLANKQDQCCAPEYGLNHSTQNQPMLVSRDVPYRPQNNAPDHRGV